MDCLHLWNLPAMLLCVAFPSDKLAQHAYHHSLEGEWIRRRATRRFFTLSQIYKICTSSFPSMNFASSTRGGIRKRSPRHGFRVPFHEIPGELSPIGSPLACSNARTKALRSPNPVSTSWISARAVVIRSPTTASVTICPGYGTNVGLYLVLWGSRAG